MLSITSDILKMLEILPTEDQELAYNLIKKLVIAWDPDFTKVTPEEAIQIKKAENSGFIPEDEIDWENLGV